MTNVPIRYSDHFVILDRSDPDRPCWRLCHAESGTGATLDVIGNVTGHERGNVALWASIALGECVRLQDLPRAVVYRLGVDDENGDDQ